MESIQKITCSNHSDEECRFYCENCDSLICDDCMLDKHDDCKKKITIAEYGRRKRETISETFQKAYDCIHIFEKATVQATEGKEEFNKSILKEIELVHSSRETIKIYFDSLEEEFVQNLEEAQKHANDEYDKFIKFNESRINGVKDIANKMELVKDVSAKEIAGYHTFLHKITENSVNETIQPQLNAPKYLFNLEYRDKDNLRRVFGCLDDGVYEDVQLPPKHSPLTLTKNVIDKFKDKSRFENNEQKLVISRGELLQPRQESTRETNTDELYSEERGSDLYERQQNRLEMIKSYDNKTKVDLIVPMKTCRHVWLIGSEIASLDFESAKHETILRSLSGSCITACRSEANGLVFGLEEAKQLRLLYLKTEQGLLRRGTKLSLYLAIERKHRLVTSCSTRCNTDIAICLQSGEEKMDEKSGSRNNDVIIEWYNATRNKVKELRVPLMKINNGNPVHICQSSHNSNIILTCASQEAESWIIVLDTTGKILWDFSVKGNKEEVTEKRSRFRTAAFLNNGNITILDTGRSELHCLNDKGVHLQTDKLEKQPTCMAVDDDDNVWIAFDDAEVRLLHYIGRYETLRLDVRTAPKV